MSANPMARVVEKQMRNWELSRSQRLAIPEPERQEVEDFICVSRRVGTPGAAEIAARIGKALDWPVFDKEVLDTMAGNDFFRRQIYASMDQRDLSWSEEVLRSFLDDKFDRNDYFRRLYQTLLSLARQGSAVFVGRGADLVLPAERGLRVRLIASHEARLAWVAKERGLEPAAAAAEIVRLEKMRSEFLVHHFKLDPATSARFDLTLHLERFTPDQVVELILRALEIRRKAAHGLAAAT